MSQMLSGSCILFTAGLSVIVLRAKLNMLHYVGARQLLHTSTASAVGRPARMHLLTIIWHGFLSTQFLYHLGCSKHMYGARNLSRVFMFLSIFMSASK